MSKPDIYGVQFYDPCEDIIRTRYFNCECMAEEFQKFMPKEMKRTGVVVVRINKGHNIYKFVEDLNGIMRFQELQ